MFNLFTFALFLQALSYLGFDYEEHEEFEKLASQSCNLGLLWISDCVRGVDMLIYLVQNLKGRDHFIVLGVRSGLERGAYPAATVLLETGLDVEDAVHEAGRVADLVLLLTHALAFNVLVVDALHHELEGFRSVCLAVKRKEVCLVGELEEFASQL